MTGSVQKDGCGKLAWAPSAGRKLVFSNLSGALFGGTRAFTRNPDAFLGSVPA
ncbi:hypothetical protein [Robinsoniella peoriensis]|uniref:hypothetical protein n=1 Tax=Robinsoniella peoriensis TaxID=180332 RepID=UPI001376122C|nr:hypothetical protein [Robinsoniella peoriensis]